MTDEQDALDPIVDEPEGGDDAPDVPQAPDETSDPEADASEGVNDSEDVEPEHDGTA